MFNEIPARMTKEDGYVARGGCFPSLLSSEFIKGPATSGEFLYMLVWKSLASSKRLADVLGQIERFAQSTKEKPPSAPIPASMSTVINRLIIF